MEELGYGAKDSQQYHRYGEQMYGNSTQEDSWDDGFHLECVEFVRGQEVNGLSKDGQVSGLLNFKSETVRETRGKDTHKFQWKMERMNQ